jgi:hypothetical protein
MTSVLPLVRIVFVSVLLAVAGLLTAFTLGARHDLPLLYGKEVQVVVSPNR